MTQTDYFVHQLTPTTCRVSKSVNGSLIPDSVYEVSDHHCQCRQAERGECRHVRMRAAWLRTVAPLPALVDWDRDTVEALPHELG